MRALGPRATGWLDWHTGQLLTDAGGTLTTAPCPPVPELLAAAARLDIARVYLTGPRPFAGDQDGWHRWCHAQPGEGWAVGEHYTERPEAPVLRWQHQDGRRLEVLRSAAWGCGEDAGPGVCRWAWQALGELVAEHWPGAVLMSTPATTGRELLAWSIPPSAEWPCLPDDVAELVRSTTGQGRIQFLAPLGAELPQLVEVDGRVMYGALCRELPGGPVQRGLGMHRFGPHARARLRASWTVPEGWAHVGLLPAHDGDGWTYPATPGQQASGWLDGAELHLAQRHGWPVQVHEHLVWPHKGTGPLDGWALRLLAIIDQAPGLYVEPIAALVGAGARRLVIDTIGALVGRPQRVTRSAPLDQAGELVPAGARMPRVEGDAVVWEETRPAPWPEMVHPEWSAAVWARCRVRMLSGPSSVRGQRTGALHVPLSELVAIRTDALYLTADPGWPDDGRAGRLRVKAVHPGPLPAPRSAPELLALRDRLRAG